MGIQFLIPPKALLNRILALLILARNCQKHKTLLIYLRIKNTFVIF
mgnify:FL=1